MITTLISIKTISIAFSFDLLIRFFFSFQTGGCLPVHQCTIFRILLENLGSIRGGDICEQVLFFYEPFYEYFCSWVGSLEILFVLFNLSCKVYITVSLLITMSALIQMLRRRSFRISSLIFRTFFNSWSTRTFIIFNVFPTFRKPFMPLKTIRTSHMLCSTFKLTQIAALVHNNVVYKQVSNTD